MYVTGCNQYNKMNSKQIFTNAEATVTKFFLPTIGFPPGSINRHSLEETQNKINYKSGCSRLHYQIIFLNLKNDVTILCGVIRESLAQYVVCDVSDLP